MRSLLCWYHKNFKGHLSLLLQFIQTVKCTNKCSFCKGSWDTLWEQRGTSCGKAQREPAVVSDPCLTSNTGMSRAVSMAKPPFTYLQSEELHASHQGPPEELSFLPSLATSPVSGKRILPARHGLGLFLWILLPLLSYKHLKTKQNRTIIPTTQSCYLLPSIILETVPFFFCMSVRIWGGGGGGFDTALLPA